MLRPSVRSGLALVGLVLFVVSCQLVLGIDRPVAEPGPDAGPPAVDPCQHARPPPRPLPANESRDSQSYWMAGERVILPLVADGGVKAGLDLDDSCTCQKDLHDGAPSCVTSHQAEEACDFDGGVDDALTALSARFPVDALFDPGGVVNRLIAEGSRTFLFYLERYNGQPNDSDVGLAIVNAGGLFSDLGCDDLPRGRTSRGKAPDVPAEQFAPAWDGCDRWSPFEGLTFDSYPNVRAVTAASGYVSDGVLVAKIDTFGLSVLGESAFVRSGHLVARLTKRGESFAMEGILTGRMPFKYVVSLVGRNEVGVGQPLCGTQLWPLVGSSLCAARDIMEDSSREGRGEPCDAASVVIGFTALPARASDLAFTPTERVIECDASVVCD